MGQYDRKKQSQPKHGKPNDSGASKAPSPLTRGMPGWRAPGYHPKKKSAATPKASAASDPPKALEHVISPGLEQRILEVFRTTFPASNDFEALKPTLQQVKEALVRRDFDEAFGTDERLEAYAIRWSPSLALGYAQLLAWICEERANDTCIQQLAGSTSDQSVAKAVCFGGGAAEIMAFAGLKSHLRPSTAAGKPGLPAAEVSDSLEAMSISAPNSAGPCLYLNFIDVADWASVLSKLSHGLIIPPTLSKYASAAARAANASILSPGTVEHAFTRSDVLNVSTEELRIAIGTAPTLLTLMSTLNELYTASMPRTTSFLRKLTEAVPKGSLLLVVDTPGAYSEVSKEGEETRKYPMSRLLDYALVPHQTKGPGQDDSDDEKPESTWEKVINEPSMSYRLEQDLQYPVSLENSKFQARKLTSIKLMNALDSTLCDPAVMDGDDDGNVLVLGAVAVSPAAWQRRSITLALLEAILGAVKGLSSRAVGMPYEDTSEVHAVVSKEQHEATHDHRIAGLLWACATVVDQRLRLKASHDDPKSRVWEKIIDGCYDIRSLHDR